MSKRRITAQDVQKFEWPGNPVFSPDGRWVVYERTVANVKDDDYETHLVLAAADGSISRTLTHAGKRNWGPVWSPDGKTLAFLSNRSFGTQVWLLPMDGGEARRLTRFRRGIRALTWAPDGSRLYGLVPVPKDGSVELYDEGLSEKEAKEQADKDREEWEKNPKRYDWIYYKRDGGGLTRGFKNQLVAVDVATGAVQQLTSGPYDVGEPAVSPDGKYIAFPSNRAANPELEYRSDLYRVPATGGELELLCNDAIVYQLTYSPDGKSIAFFGHRNEYWFATHTRLFLVPSDGGSSVDLCTDFPDTLGDECVSDMRSHEHTPGPLWSKDGRCIYALSTREGRCEVVRFTLNGNTATGEVVIGGDREIYGLSFDGGSRFAIAYATPVHPGRVATVDITGGPVRPRPPRAVTEPMSAERVTPFPSGEVRLDTCNDALLAEVEVVEPEVFFYTSEDGWQVQGFVLKPVGFEPGKKYPVILEIHGGPHAMYAYSFFHEMQWFAAEGYAVVYVNPRGSSGYGQEFVNAVRHHYGEKDAADILNGLDAALEKFDFLDGDRVAVTGGSYGGFMTNWLVGHTDRFFAAVSQRSISNWISFYGVSDIGPRFTETEVGGDVLHDFDKLWKASPLAYADNVKTPLLLKHGENDLRCPIEQAEQFYTAIKRNGGEVELFRVPNASHDLSRTGKPKLRVARLEAMFRFIHDRLPNRD
ncbi:alpha/beta hydrolase family protein [Alicyclobacillus macrosporangiidus]|uniref:S9 family peptidase n=1 Tax=Alicyclobacillus macrosporangiidus TaxID=392015 RepID=UPI00049667C7|nr:S9 family peptidase [Alicyclobacillus macrosporangiidus]